MADRNQLHGDPESIRNFAQLLSGFVDRIEAFDERLVHGLARLGDTFRDEGYEKFCQHFEQSRRLLAGFVEDTRRVVPEMVKDAEAIEASQLEI